jgi:hypothetical protein
MSHLFHFLSNQFINNRAIYILTVFKRKDEKCLKWLNNSITNNKAVQAALDIRGFDIRDFDYSRFIFCDQNLVFAVFPCFPLTIRVFLIELRLKHEFFTSKY